MKRKEVDNGDADFFFNSLPRKAIRLDGGDLISIMEEDPSARVPLQLEHHQPNPFPSPTLTTTSSNAPQSSSPLLLDTYTNTMPSFNHQDKAFMLCNPSITPFFASSSSPDFSIIIDSSLYPGLKDCFILPNDSWVVKSTEDKATVSRSTREPNDCLAVVPWVAPQLPLTSGTETGIIYPSQPMEAEDMEGEMMDTDNSGSNIAGKASQDDEMDLGTEAFQLILQQQRQQKQHGLPPLLPENMYPRVS